MYCLFKSFVFWFILGDLKREHFLSSWWEPLAAVVSERKSHLHRDKWQTTRVKKSRQMLWISISSLADSKPSVPGCSVLSSVSSLPSPMVISCSFYLIHLKEAGGAEMRTLPCVMTLLKVDHSDVIIATIIYCNYRKGQYLWWRWGCIQHNPSKLFQLPAGGESLDV